MSKKISIVIPCFNGEKYITACLNSIISQESACAIHTIVVDNGSTDNSLKIIKDNFPEVYVIENEKNIGFAKAINIGIIEAMEKESEAVLLLNQDTTLPPCLIETLYNSESDIVAPVLSFHRNGKTIYDFGGIINHWTGRTTHLEAEENKIVKEPIDYVSFCCVLIRRKVFEMIGLLDEKYFLYFEDVDYCLRAKANGLTISVNNKVTVNHEIAEHKNAKGGLNNFKTKQLLKSQLRFILNNLFGVRKITGLIYFKLLVLKIIINHLWKK